MMEFIGFLVVLIILLITIAVLIWGAVCISEAFYEDFRAERMARWNLFKWIISGASTFWNAFIAAATWRPKTGIDKEIAEEEKEITELERQKEKMDTLANLKRRKERLFSDVHRAESWECTACGDEFDNLPDYVRHVAEAHHS